MIIDLTYDNLYDLIKELKTQKDLGYIKNFILYYDNNLAQLTLKTYRVKPTNSNDFILSLTKL